MIIILLMISCKDAKVKLRCECRAPTSWVTCYFTSVFRHYFSVIQMCASAEWQIITGPRPMGHGENSHWILRVCVRILNLYGYVFRRPMMLLKLSATFCMYVHTRFFLMSVAFMSTIKSVTQERLRTNIFVTSLEVFYIE